MEIRWLKAYGPDNPPPPGDVAWAKSDQSGLILLGGHVVPKSDDPPDERLVL